MRAIALTFMLALPGMASADAVDLTTGSAGTPILFDTDYVWVPSQGDVASGRVRNNGTALQYTGVLLNVGGGVNNIFIKVQNQDGDDQFEVGACYVGNNANGFGLGFFALIEPFNNATLTARRSGSDVTVSLTNVDGGAKADQTYVCSGAPAPEGDGIGVHGFDGVATIDDFSNGSQVLDTFSFNGPLASSGDWTDIDPGMAANGSVAFGGPFARAIFTGEIGGSADLCVDFDNFVDGIEISLNPLSATWQNWDAGGRDAEFQVIRSLGGGNFRFVCVSGLCDVATELGFNAFIFTLNFPQGLFDLVGIDAGSVVSFQEDSPFTVLPGACTFGPQQPGSASVF